MRWPRRNGYRRASGGQSGPFGQHQVQRATAGATGPSITGSASCGLVEAGDGIAAAHVSIRSALCRRAARGAGARPSLVPRGHTPGCVRPPCARAPTAGSVGPLPLAAVTQGPQEPCARHRLSTRRGKRSATATAPVAAALIGGGRVCRKGDVAGGGRLFVAGTLTGLRGHSLTAFGRARHMREGMGWGGKRTLAD